MKLQHLAVLFIIIIVPISLVLSEYLHIHIQTIQMQTEYTTRLMNATHDGIKAFQLNTQNNSYSTLSNSKIRDIEASINTFYTTLGTSMSTDGYNSDDMKSFTPAILATLYDGYYIYTKYYDTVADKYTYGLKPFISYSCRYIKDNSDFVVNYTLDNTITVIGKVHGTYTTKSGHVLTQPDGVNPYNEELSENLICKDDNGNAESVDSNGIPVPVRYRYIIHNNQKLYRENNITGNIGKKYFYYSSEYKKDYLSSPDEIRGIDRGSFDSNSSFLYFAESQNFASWLRNNIGDITVADARNSDGTPITDFASDQGSARIFNISSSNDPLRSDSDFNEHRKNVIRKSIETNLITAIANYNDHAQRGYEFAMPKLGEDEWNKIENNICMVTFLQGMPIKTRMYNNYCVVANNTNQEMVGTDSIYLLDSHGEYHKPGCKKLLKELEEGTVSIVGGYQSADFVRKHVSLTGEDVNAHKQLDEGVTNGSNAYFYSQNGTACYDCIENAADTIPIDDVIANTNPDIWMGDHYMSVTNGHNLVRKAYFNALYRARYNLYTINNNFGV